MIVFIRDKKYPTRQKVNSKSVACALYQLRKDKKSIHSGKGTYLLPLLNILERRKISYKLTAIPDRGYQIDLI